MRGSRGRPGVRIPLKNHKNIGLLRISGPDPLKIYEATEPVIISMPAKRHLMALCWRADGGPLIVLFGSTHPSSTTKKKKTKKKKKKKKRCQSWTPSDKYFWIRAFEEDTIVIRTQ